MSRAAEETLSRLDPIPVTLGRILYHPQAIMLGVQPDLALHSVRMAVQRATGRDVQGETVAWIPHVTVAYSTARQPAEPIINALGMQLPSRKVTIRAVSLVVQWGPERRWDWEVVNTTSVGK